jgi:hypothetical protein
VIDIQLLRTTLVEINNWLGEAEAVLRRGFCGASKACRADDGAPAAKVVDGRWWMEDGGAATD